MYALTWRAIFIQRSEFPSLLFLLLHLIRVNLHAWLKSIHVSLFESHNLKDGYRETLNFKNLLIYVTFNEEDGYYEEKHQNNSL